jgi:ketosteroid isomerase-like protein
VDGSRPGALVGDYRGPEGVGCFFSKLPSYWPEQEPRVLEAFGGGDRVVILGEHLIMRNGRSHRIPFAHAWTVQNGLTTSFYEYTDTAKLGQILSS